MADLKLDTLIKVLLMTTSDNTSEALAAIRRANVLLRNASTDWDKLLRGKVTVVADPFTNICAPDTKSEFKSAPIVPDKPQVHTPPQPPLPKTPTYFPQAARHNNTNTSAGRCFNCDDHVLAGCGAVRDIFNVIRIFCEDCNFKVSNGQLSYQEVNRNHSRLQAKTQRQASSYTPRVKRKVTTADLMSDIFQSTPTPKPSKQIDDDMPF